MIAFFLEGLLPHERVGDGSRVCRVLRGVQNLSGGHELLVNLLPLRFELGRASLTESFQVVVGGVNRLANRSRKRQDLQVCDGDGNTLRSKTQPVPEDLPFTAPHRDEGGFLPAEAVIRLVELGDSVDVGHLTKLGDRWIDGAEEDPKGIAHPVVQRVVPLSATDAYRSADPESGSCERPCDCNAFSNDGVHATIIARRPDVRARSSTRRRSMSGVWSHHRAGRAARALSLTGRQRADDRVGDGPRLRARGLAERLGAPQPTWGISGRSSFVDAELAQGRPLAAARDEMRGAG